MAPKRSRVRKVVVSSATVAQPIASVLLKEALDDLRYLEPTRARDRVISCLNELFVRVLAIERMHEEHDSK